MRKYFNANTEVTYFVGTASEIRPIFKSLIRAFNNGVNITPLDVDIDFREAEIYGIAVSVNKMWVRGCIVGNTIFSKMSKESIFRMIKNGSISRTDQWNDGLRDGSTFPTVVWNATVMKKNKTWRKKYPIQAMYLDNYR